MSNAEMSNRQENALIKQNGEWVIKGLVKASNFVKGFSTRIGHNSYFEGSWIELEQLVMEHFDNNEPGTGSVDGDVLLINVPAKGFHTSIIKITDENRHLVEEIEYVRQAGEKPVITRVIKNIEKPEAKFAKIVVYRADVLDKDNDRSSMAEWEIVSINAQNYETVPMSPSTMLRNTNHEAGGTYREYTQEQWDESYAFWDNHASIEITK